jgi:hypothetical protein
MALKIMFSMAVTESRKILFYEMWHCIFVSVPEECTTSTFKIESYPEECV